MTKRTPGWLVLLLGTIWLLTGCASTRVASMWKDPADAAPPVRKIAVFVAVKDDALRRFAENQAVRSLAPGTEGVPGHALFPQPQQDIAALSERLAREGFDGALISRLVSVDKTRIYHPPEVRWAPIGPWPYSPYYGSFYWYYPHAFSYVTPGYTSELTKVLVETIVYRLPEGRPVWSALTETTNPDSTLELVNELIDILGTRLRRAGLIAGS